MAMATVMVTAMAEKRPSKNSFPLWDIHSHFLPGIDDGSPDWATTLKMMNLAWKTGIRPLVATPHHLPWVDPIPRAKIYELCIEAHERFYERTGNSMEILPGQELYYHSGLLDDLDERRALTLNGGDTILVEFSTRVPYEDLLHATRELSRGGYQVILAHLERYHCLREDDDMVEELMDDGVLLQSNIYEMLRPGWFDETKRWLKKLYNKKAISFIASDMHNTSSRHPMTPEEVDWFRKKMDQDYFEDLLGRNAEELL